MPIQYKPLTEEEKNKAKDLNVALIERINGLFAKISLNNLKVIDETAELEKRFEDESLVARYRLSQEIKELNDSYTRAINEIKGEFKFPDGRDYLAGSIKYLLKTDGSNESKEYNRKLLDAYTKNPEEFTYKRIKKLMNYNPKELLEIGDDKVKLLEFYKNNMALCHEANEFGDIFSRKDLKITKELQEAKESFKILVQKINQVGNIEKESRDLTFIAFPNLSYDKNKYISDNMLTTFQGKGFNNVGAVLKSKVYPIPNLSQYMKKLEEKGLKFDTDKPFLKYKAIETNPQTGKTKEVSIDKFLENEPNVTVVERSQEEIKRLNNITLKYEIKYSNEFQKRMGEKFAKSYNIFEVQKEMAGGWYDRRFRKPSPEFKDFMQKLTDFTNPEKKGFLDKAALKEAGEKYLAHTNANPVNNAMRDRRIELVNNTIATLTEMETEDNKIRNDINKEIYSVLPKDLDVEKEVFMNEDEVDLEPGPQNNNISEDINLSNENEIDLNKTN